MITGIETLSAIQPAIVTHSVIVAVPTSARPVYAPTTPPVPTNNASQPAFSMIRACAASAGAGQPKPCPGDGSGPAAAPILTVAVLRIRSPSFIGRLREYRSLAYNAVGRFALRSAHRERTRFSSKLRGQKRNDSAFAADWLLQTSTPRRIGGGMWSSYDLDRLVRGCKRRLQSCLRGVPRAGAIPPTGGGYCGLVVVVELVVLPPLLGSISVFEWVSELPAEPCL